MYIKPLSWDLLDFWGFGIKREDDGEEDDWGFEDDIVLLCWCSTISCWEDLTLLLCYEGITLLFLMEFNFIFDVTFIGDKHVKYINIFNK